MDDLQKECDWMRRVRDGQHEEMNRLGTEVARLGQQNEDLRQRVSELEGMNAGSAHTSGSARTSDSEDESPVRITADASVAGVRVSEMPKEVSQGMGASSKAIEWKKHPEAKKGGARAASCGGPCQNCHGGKVLDPKEEESLKLAWEDYPLRLWSWVTHLGSTLFMEHGTRHWSEIEKKLWSSQGRFLVWGSQKPNQRMFVCKCTECGAIVTAQYAVGDGEVDAQDARDTLAMFVIGKKAEDSKRT